MRLACPSCRAVYEIPDALIGGSRRLRCARCPAEWVATPAPEAPAAAQGRPDDAAARAGLGERVAAESAAAAPASIGPTSLPPPTSDPAPSLRPEARPSLVSGGRPETRPAPAAQPRRARALTTVLAWLLTFAVLGAGAASCYRWRGEVMAAWPPSQRVYAALGLH
jgi:predicted Zn finger-like uncharacterized protein